MIAANKTFTKSTIFGNGEHALRSKHCVTKENIFGVVYGLDVSPSGETGFETFKVVEESPGITEALKVVADSSCSIIRQVVL